MTTAADAIDAIANKAGIGRATVFRAARAMREAERGLWPKGAQGRGREAHARADHLVNLLLALAVAEPLTEAPEIVPIYSGLVPDKGMLSEAGDVEDEGRHFETAPRFPDTPQPSSLGAALTGLVEDLAYDKVPANVLQRYRNGWSCNLQCAIPWVPSLRPISEIVQPGPGTSQLRVRYCRSVNPTIPGLFDNGTERFITKSARIDFRIMELLGELFADTLAHQAPKKDEAAGAPSPRGLDGKPTPKASATLTGPDPNLSTDAAAARLQAKSLGAKPSASQVSVSGSGASGSAPPESENAAHPGRDEAAKSSNNQALTAEPGRSAPNRSRRYPIPREPRKHCESAASVGAYRLKGPDCGDPCSIST